MTPPASSIDDREIARFGRLSEDWWNPQGPMRALHKLNPTRIEWLRDRIAEHFPAAGGSRRDVKTGRPLEGLRILDIGCGAGLLSEPMARLGGDVTGLDPAQENVAVARAHAEAVGAAVDYRAQSAESLAAEGARFDVVLAMEVIEHVVDAQSFVATACALAQPDGMVFFSTLNRTLKSFALGIVAAEYVLRWVPRGTHRWEKFVKPQELAQALTDCDWTMTDGVGVVFDPLRDRWRVSRDMDVNYMAAAVRRPAAPPRTGRQRRNPAP